LLRPTGKFPGIPVSRWASPNLAICENLMPVLLPPLTENDFKTRASEFWERWNFPNCVGAIDGKHVRVMSPDKTGSLYFN